MIIIILRWHFVVHTLINHYVTNDDYNFSCAKLQQKDSMHRQRQIWFGFSKEEWFRNSAPHQVPARTSAVLTASSSAAVLAAAVLVYHRALPPLLNYCKYLPRPWASRPWRSSIPASESQGHHRTLLSPWTRKSTALIWFLTYLQQGNE